MELNPMSELTNLLAQAFSGGTLESISRRIGADEGSTATAISAALPILLGALDRNTDHPSGADALLNALQGKHDGSILDDLAGFLGGGHYGDGDKILGHVLGGKRSSVESGLSRASGLDLSSVAQLLPMLAPIVMGAVGKLQRQHDLDAAGLSRALSEQRSRAVQAQPHAMSALESLLDTNDDGKVVDDVVKIGSSLLGSFFKQ
jgi:hypothetical protein